uniref:D-aminoacyl-tRNA deacylase n=1 Tax=Strigamia maritima TaxID=126957 RepID=T1IYM9_STRMM
MRFVVQRVLTANVSINDEIISSIGRGLCVLVGISRDDTSKDADYMIKKLLNLRIFENDNGKRWSLSVSDKKFEILCVSQFTLYCTLKGNKPDFHLSMEAEKSKLFYAEFLDKLRRAYQPDLVKDGQFGALMQVNIQNDGPVTINLEYGGKTAAEESNP